MQGSLRAGIDVERFVRDEESRGGHVESCIAGRDGGEGKMAGGVGLGGGAKRAALEANGGSANHSSGGVMHEAVDDGGRIVLGGGRSEACEKNREDRASKHFSRAFSMCKFGCETPCYRVGGAAS